MFSPESEVYDVAVIGAGFAGVGLTFDLASRGRKVLLVESRPSVGWEATWAHNLELVRGISKHADELAGRIAAVNAAKGERIDQVAAEIELLRMLEGTRILHYCHPAGITLSGRQAISLQLAGKSGVFSVRARAFVDATDSGRLLSLAALDHSPAVPAGHVFSFCLNDVEQAANLPQAIPFEGSKILFKPSVWKDEVAVEFVTGMKPCFGRQAVPEVLAFLRHEVPALKNAFLTHAAIEELPLFRAAGPGKVETGVDNLFNLSGPGTAVAFEERRELLARRMKRGEDAAAAISSALNDLPPSVSSAPPSLPLIEDCPGVEDVIVCGGGTAGAIAALAAARRGCKTFLIESATSLGGIGTAGAIHSYYHGVGGGIQDEIDAATAELGAAFAAGHRVSGFHPEAKKIVLLRLLEEAGATVRFRTTLTEVETGPAESGAGQLRILSLVAHSDEAGLRLRAANYIDSTGDADLAAKAGCPFTFGRDFDAVPHAYSQPSGKYEEKKALAHHNFDAGYCDPSDPWDMSRARVAGIKQYTNSSYAGGSRLLFIAPVIGIRNSRLIKGKYRLTFYDQLQSAEFDDVVAYAFSHYDNHARDYENESLDAIIWVWALGRWPTLLGCEIPFRCLMPENITNLLVACRAVSMDFDAHNQLRMMRDMQRIGEAAGIAAAIAGTAGCSIQDVDVKKLQAELFNAGALKDSEHGYHWKGWKPEALFAVSDRKLLAARGPAGLLEAAGSTEATVTAMPLALAGDKSAVSRLVSVVREKNAFQPEGFGAVPIWKPAIAVLGAAGATEIVPDLERMLLDPSADQAALMLAIRALGQIGEKSSADALEKMLARTDLPGEQLFKVSSGGIEPVRENLLWKLELAAAEALARLGRPRPDLVEKYLEDERAVVRRRAAKAGAVGPENNPRKHISN